MTGYELLRKCAATQRFLAPFVMVTAESKAENVVCAPAGVNNYIIAVQRRNQAKLKTVLGDF